MYYLYNYIYVYYIYNILKYPAERDADFGTKLSMRFMVAHHDLVAKRPRQAAAHIVKPCSHKHGTGANSDFEEFEHCSKWEHFGHPFFILGQWNCHVQESFF